MDYYYDNIVNYRTRIERTVPSDELSAIKQSLNLIEEFAERRGVVKSSQTIMHDIEAIANANKIPRNEDNMYVADGKLGEMLEILYHVAFRLDEFARKGKVDLEMVEVEGFRDEKPGPGTLRS